MLRYLVTHPAVITSALTVLTITLTALGVVPPVIPHFGEIAAAALAVATAFFGLKGEEAAYLAGVLDQLEGIFDGDDDLTK
jgi:hypothetical protein